MKRVLLVDGHPWFRQALAIVLEQRTDLKDNVQAESLGEARRLLADLDAKIDLAIVDLDLPEGGATELIEHLHEFGVPVIAITAERSLEQLPRALRAGADEVLTMATSAEQIIDTAKRLVGG